MASIIPHQVPKETFSILEGELLLLKALCCKGPVPGRQKIGKEEIWRNSSFFKSKKTHAAAEKIQPRNKYPKCIVWLV